MIPQRTTTTIITTTVAALAGAFLAAAIQERRIARAHHDSAFGMLTRQGVDAKLGRLRGPVDIVYLDLDFVHELNHQLGEQEVDRMVRAAFQLRLSDIVFIGRWKSGDEILVVVRAGEGAALSERIRDRLVSFGLSATIGVVQAGNYYAAIQDASQRVRLAKVANNRGRVLNGGSCGR